MVFENKKILTEARSVHLVAYTCTKCASNISKTNLQHDLESVTFKYLLPDSIRVGVKAVLGT